MIFDSELSFIPHIKNITKIRFYHLKNIARVCLFLSQARMEVLMHAFISCRLDYCNALLSGLPKNHQLLQNSAARVLTRTRGREHITPVLKSLHWLPVCFRVNFKVLFVVLKCLNGFGPSYLSDLLLPYQPSRTLRSSGTGLLTIPRVRLKTHGEAPFVDVFEKRLKTPSDGLTTRGRGQGGRVQCELGSSRRRRPWRSDPRLLKLALGMSWTPP